MFCSNCGAQLPDDAEFCSNCGQKIEPASTSEPASDAAAKAEAAAGHPGQLRRPSLLGAEMLRLQDRAFYLSLFN